MTEHPLRAAIHVWGRGIVSVTCGDCLRHFPVPPGIRDLSTVDVPAHDCTTESR